MAWFLDILSRRGAARVAAATLALMPLAACSVPKEVRQKADAAVVKAQVGLMQATNDARAKAEQRQTEEALASLEAARNGGWEEDHPGSASGGVELGDRYTTLREADGSWTVYDAATGRTVQRRDASGGLMNSSEARTWADDLNRAEQRSIDLGGRPR